jgi:PPM family protein phosphatase
VTFEAQGLTDRGLRRHHNEDRFLVRSDLGLFVVADGMGGHAAGEVAADIAVREVELVVEETRDFGGSTWPEDWDPALSISANRLSRAIISGHRRVTGAVEGDLGLKGMGATIVAALIEPDGRGVTIAHVGDSRAYLFRERHMELLTSDHSWVHEQVIGGLLTEEAARNHPLKNVVTRALGGAQEPMVDTLERDVRPADMLLLCSDGLNTMLTDREIEETLLNSGNLPRAAHQLVAEANRRGGLDNITVILIAAPA